jgi:hypothetical protein
VCGPEPDSRPAELADTQQFARLIADSPATDHFNLFIDVANVQGVPAEVRVDVDGQSALAVSVPRQADECAVTPVYRYGLAVPPGEVGVVASTDTGHGDDMTVEATDSPSWIVVQLQPDIALEMEHFDHAPGWD